VKKWIFIGIGVVVLAAIIIANLTGSGAPSVEAKITAVERADITSRISAPGRVRAVSSVDISAEVPGRIIELAVEEGDSVTQGYLLLRLDDAQYRSRVEQAEAAYRSARASMSLSEARLEKFENDKNRLKALQEQDLASAEAEERAVTDYRVQIADVEARREEVARLNAARADARDNFEKTVYRAPVSGIVAQLNVEEGEIVITGTMNNPGTVILTIADLSAMEVEAEVDETDVVDVEVGQKASITVDAIADTTFEGTVVTVGNSGRRRGGGAADEVINFEVKVRFDDSDSRLKPGMTADVEVETRTRRGVLAVPIQSLVARSQGKLEQDRKAAARKQKKDKKNDAEADTSGGSDSDTTEAMSDSEREKWEKEVVEGVYKIVDEKAVFTKVKTGIADESKIEVSGDLAEGDDLVNGPYRVLRGLKEGTRIKKAEDKERKQDSR
jgi:HlyD family secretion protein